MKPGDKFTLLNYGNAEVIVDETDALRGRVASSRRRSRSRPSSSIGGSPRCQQSINRGLSPNAAVLDLLDVDEPKPPVVTAGFTVSQKREGRKDYDLQAVATTVNEDIENVGTYVSRYEFRARPIYPAGHASAGQPIPEDRAVAGATVPCEPPRMARPRRPRKSPGRRSTTRRTGRGRFRAGPLTR